MVIVHLVLLLGICVVQGLKVAKTIGPSSFPSRSFTKFESFGFDAGGTITLKSSTTSPNLKIYICEQAEYQRRRMLWTDGWPQVCSISDPRYHLFDTNEEKHITVGKQGFLYFGVIDCTGGATDYIMSLEYELHNTEGFGQLSYGQQHSPTMTSINTGLWLLGLCVFLALLLGQPTLTTPFHWILVGLICLKVTISAIKLSYWWVFATEGSDLTLLTKVSDVVFAICEAGFFVMLYFLSKGWRLVRGSVPTDEIRSVCVVLIAVVVGLTFFTSYSLDYYRLTLLILYFFILPKVVTSLTEMMMALDSQITTVSQFPAFDDLLDSFERKHLVFRRLRAVLIAFFIAVLVVNCVVKMLTPWPHLWIVDEVNDLIALTLYAAFCFYLRPYRGLFFLSIADLYAHDSIKVNDDGADVLVPWDLSKTVVIEQPRCGDYSLAYQEEYEKRESRLVGGRGKVESSEEELEEVSSESSVSESARNAL